MQGGVPMQRIVSLLPSTTEIVHALGCGDRLVGRSHECDHPDGGDGPAGRHRTEGVAGG